MERERSRARERTEESERERHTRRFYVTHLHWSIKGRVDITPCTCHVEHLFDWVMNRMNVEKRETQRRRDREEERETKKKRAKESKRKRAALLSDTLQFQSLTSVIMHSCCVHIPSDAPVCVSEPLRD